MTFISGIEVQGKCFGEGTSLEFFPVSESGDPNATRVALVYGRNGSGKSTISQSFSLFESQSELATGQWVSAREAADNRPENNRRGTFAARLLSSEKSSDAEQQAILVFNERFIDENVKVKSGGLGAVVLFGDQVDLVEEIESATSALGALSEEKIDAISASSKADEELAAAEKRLESELKKGWAERSRRILGGPNATKSWVDTKAHIKAIEPTEGVLSENLVDLEQRISSFGDIDGAERMHRAGPQLSRESLLPGEEATLFKETLVAVRGEGLSELVADALQRFETQLRAGQEIFSSHEVSHCPMCLQEVSEGYLKTVRDAVNAALDDSADRLRERLERAKLQKITTSLLAIDSKLGTELGQEAERVVIAYNTEVDKWNEACERKKTHMYAILEWEGEHLERAVEGIFEVLTKANEAVEDWNSRLADRERVQRELIKLNDRISRQELSALVDRCTKTREYAESEQTRVIVNTRDEAAARERVAELKTKASNVQIAADEINMHIEGIFAERDRLKLRVEADSSSEQQIAYSVLTRGEALPPEELSLGERNILALAYYFTLVRREVEQLGKQGRLLVVIDDPVSSVDIDNRLGIHGFLESQMKSILLSNDKSQVIMLTHDLTVARDLLKSAGAALPTRPNGSKPSKWSVASYTLGISDVRRGSPRLVPRNLSKFNEYDSLLQVAYRYASAENVTDVGELANLTIGNIVRRILEAFSSFIYGDGILGDALSQAYSEAAGGRSLAVDLRAGHRGFLHDSSHAEDSMTSLRGFGGFSGLEPTEQRLHVQRILAFMYTIQEMHMRAHLPQGAEKDVKRWSKRLASASN